MNAPSSFSHLHGLTAIGFVRVSTDQQGDSPATQRRRIQQFARDNAINLTETIELVGSGRNAWRDPAVISIIEQAEQGSIRLVLVARLDRMGRSTRTDLFIDELTAAGAALIDISSEQISGNAAHRRAMRSGIATARNESEITQERVTEGIQGHWDAHRDPWGFAALGYQRLQATDNQKCDPGCTHRLLAIDPESASDAISLFERYALGNTSIDDLAINAPIVRAGRYRGGPMTREGIADLLANTIYIGQVSRGTETAQREDLRLINDELWQRVQTIRQRRSRGGSKPRSRHLTPFARLLECASCGQRLRLDGTGGSGYHRVRHMAPCSEWGTVQRRPLRIWAEPLEAQMAQLDVSPEMVAQIVAELGTTQPNQPLPIRFQQERDRLYNALRARRISGADFDERLTAVDSEEKAWRDAHWESPEPTYSPKQIREAIDDLRTTWNLAGAAERVAVASAIYERIRVTSDGFPDENAVTFSTEAENYGLTHAAPETVTISGGLACPIGLQHDNQPTRIVHIPINRRRTNAAEAEVLSQ